MTGTVKVKGVKELRRMLRKHGEVLAAEGQKIIKATARGLAVEYGRYTSPPDFAPAGTDEKYRKKIEKQTRYIYPTRDDFGKVFELIKQRDVALANAYYVAVKEGRWSRAEALLRQANVPQGGASVAALKAARTGKAGSVPARAHPPVSLLRTSESRRFAREQGKLVGTAKAGWHQAAKGIGGRVRSNYVDAKGRRSTPEKFPKYVRAVSRRINGLGGAWVTVGRVRIYSNVRHAREAMNEKREIAARIETMERMRKMVQVMVEKLAQKFNKAA